MTVYILDPELLSSPSLKEIAAKSDDPVRQVACQLILPNGKVFEGYNNACFDTPNKDFWTKKRSLARLLVTHAEEDAIQRAVAWGELNFEGATMYVTLEPCCECRKLIELAGISEVYYGEVYVRREI